MLQDQGRPVSPVVHTFQVYSMREERNTSIKGSDNRCTLYSMREERDSSSTGCDNRCTGLERRGTPAVQAVIAGVHCTG